MRNFFNAINVIAIITIFCLIVLYFLFESKVRVAQIKNDCVKLHERLVKIKSDPILLKYASKINAEQNNNLSNELIQQLTPLFNLHSRDDAIPYSDQTQRIDFIKGYTSAWYNSITSENCNLARLLRDEVQVGSNDRAESSKENILNNTLIPPDNEQTTLAYKEGWLLGIKQVDKTCNKIKTDFINFKEKHPEQDLTQIAQFDFINENESAIQEKLSAIPSLQAFVIIQKILKDKKTN